MQLAARKSKKSVVSGMDSALYSLGSIPHTLTNFSITVLGLFYCISVQSIPAFLAGILIFVASVVGNGLTVLVRFYMSRIKNVFFGKLYLYLILGAFLIPVFTAAFYLMPIYYGLINKVIYLFIMLVFLNFSLRLYSVPYVKISTLLSTSANEQNNLEFNKNIFSLFFSFSYMMLLYLILNQQDILTFQITGSLLATVALLFGAGSFLGTFNHLPRLNIKNKEDGRQTNLKEASVKFIKPVFSGVFKNALKAHFFYKAFIAVFLSSGLILISGLLKFDVKIAALFISGIFTIMLLTRIFYQYLFKKYVKAAVIFGAAFTGLIILAMFLIFILLSFNIIPTQICVPVIAVFCALLGLSAGCFDALPEYILRTMTVTNFENIVKEPKFADIAQLYDALGDLGSGAAVLLTGIAISIFGFNPLESLQTGLFYTGLNLLAFAIIIGVFIASAVFYIRFAFQPPFKIGDINLKTSYLNDTKGEDT